MIALATAPKKTRKPARLASPSTLLEVLLEGHEIAPSIGDTIQIVEMANLPQQLEGDRQRLLNNLRHTENEILDLG